MVHYKKHCFIIDPRFDGLSGKFNYDLYRKSYKFIEEQQEEEIKEMKEKMYNTTDVGEKRAIQVRPDYLIKCRPI